jgi:sterol desaturase/sphingolipid hydroxylase (fatty acid hydroxylase superfamily)
VFVSFLPGIISNTLDPNFHVDLVTGGITSSALPAFFLDFYHATLRVFMHPGSVLDVMKISMTFTIIAIIVCSLVEHTNPKAWSKERIAVIKSELMFSLKSWMLAPVIAMGLLHYAYPAIHGHTPPMFPASIYRFFKEVAMWAFCFDFTQYISHRTLHITSVKIGRDTLYAAVHKAHHSFPEITAFSAQTNSVADTFFTTGVESMVFLLFPISFAAHALCGFLLFTFASFIHDCEDRLDGGFHREHHSNPVFNYGFLGLADLTMGTVYFGPTRDGLPEPRYAARFETMSRYLFPWRPSPRKLKTSKTQ